MESMMIELAGNPMLAGPIKKFSNTVTASKESFRFNGDASEELILKLSF